MGSWPSLEGQRAPDSPIVCSNRTGPISDRMAKQKKPKGKVKGPRMKEEIEEREENLDSMYTEQWVDSNLLSGVRLQRH